MSKSENNELDFTGERVVPGRTETLLLEEHVARYQLALKYAKDAKVLDAASGAGYGSLILATEADHVTGVEISEDAVNFARKNFNNKNIEYVVSDVLSLPFEENTFDLVTAFEILEHVTEPVKLLAELRRVVKNGGNVIVSTPNVEFCETTIENPFHVKEYTLDEFRQLIADNFTSNAEFLGQPRFPPPRSLKTYFNSIKRMLGIDPIFEKRHAKIASPKEVLSMKTPPYFMTEDLNQAAFFIAIIDLQK